MDALQKLGIDLWGVLIYLVNTGLLLVLLTRLLYKPLLRAIDERRSTIKRTLLESEQLRKALEAERVRQEVASRAAEQALRDEIDATKKELHRLAEAEREESRKERHLLLEKTKLEITEAKRQLVDSARTDVLRIIHATVLQLTQANLSEDTVAHTMDAAVKSLGKAAKR